MELFYNTKKDYSYFGFAIELLFSVQLAGLTEVKVKTMEETMKCLEKGSQGRTTGATAMNNQSSRSHAIFTLHIERTSKTDR